MKHYDVKIGFTNQVSGKKENESIIVYAENLIDLKVQVTEVYYDREDLEVEKVSLIKNTFFQIDDFNAETEKLFKVKIGFTSVDEKNGKEKVTTFSRIFNDKDFDTALKSVKDGLTMDEFVVSLVETNYTNFVRKDKE